MPTMTREQESANYAEMVRTFRDRHQLPEHEARDRALKLCGQRFAHVMIPAPSGRQEPPTGLEARLDAAERELAARRTTAAPAVVERPKDRDAVWSDLRAAAFAVRRPGQSDEQAVDAFLMTERGQKMYGEYRRAPAAERQTPSVSGLETAPTGSAAVFAQHRGMALQARREGETEEAAISRFYDEQPAAYAAYQLVRAAEIRGA